MDKSNILEHEPEYMKISEYEKRSEIKKEKKIKINMKEELIKMYFR